MKEGKSPPDEPGKGALRDLGRYSGYGMSWALVTLLGGWAGLVLDERLGTSPWLVFIGAFGGAAAGFYTLYVRLIVEPGSEKDENE